ncbi:unnamed protein product [Sphagnum troendelagicum]|uniref:Dehydrin n=1 Tax=Sphagnum troendelagicum TaxID=128251 RepID=A0ABP0TTC4_9BRYO
MADYNNENQHESAEQFSDPAQQQPDQIDEGNQETSDFQSGVGGPVTDDTNFGAPQQDSSEGVGIPKNYEGGEQGEYNTGNGQQQQTDSADGDVPPAQEEQKYQDASAPGYDDKSAVGDTDGTGTFDQPTTDQTQLGTDETTNGSYDAGTQPPAGETAAPPPPAETPKKESLMTKLKEKLPGHHKSTDDQTTAATADEDETTGDTPPKQGLVSKIKEKIHM